MDSYGKGLPLCQFKSLCLFLTLSQELAVREQNMAELLVQVQPELLREFSEQSIEQLRVTDTQPSTVSKVTVTSGSDNGLYINVCFVTANVKVLWPTVRQQVVRLGLQSASIITCTGSEGWHNYLLLHHFNHEQVTDALAAL